MNEVYEFLKQAGTFYVATVDGDQPRVRPFGATGLLDGKIYIQTGKIKNVSKQIAANPKIEICAMTPDRRWIRIACKAIEDDRYEARHQMLEINPNLRRLYSEDDGNCEVLYLAEGTATISSFSAPDVVYQL